LAHPKLPILDETGFVVLKKYETPVAPAEWEGLEYVDWKSGGDTNFAPIASALGELECAGFWDHGKPDKDGVWTVNAKECPTLVKWTEDVGARFGRVRIIKLEPQDYEGTMRVMHQDDNNRLNPDGEGWVVRAWLNLTDDPDSYMVVRDDKDDPSTEHHIPCPAGAQAQQGVAPRPEQVGEHLEPGQEGAAATGCGSHGTHGRTGCARSTSAGSTTTRTGNPLPRADAPGTLPAAP
jgi:hypothetical protein